jgi:hypothetical protein
MGLQDSRAKLTRVMKELSNLWITTKIDWSDANTEKFEETYIRPLEMDVKVAAAAMDEMGVLLTKIRHECE